MKCEISSWTCPYHACGSDECQLSEVLESGSDFGPGNCDKKAVSRAKAARKRWDKDDLKVLKKHYPDMKNEELAKMLYRSTLSVAVKANKMGLKKSKLFLKMNCGFSKGYTPFNKGRKMEEWLSPEVHEKIKENHARTAERNRAAALPDGSVTRRYNGEYIKVAGEWVKMSHHVWAAHHGEVPEGYGVFFRDGDMFNTSPENLYIDKKNDPTVVLAHKTTEERREMAARMWDTRRQKQAEQEAQKDAELDELLEEIRRSNNNIYYRPQI